jgi:hypothetical protein
MQLTLLLVGFKSVSVTTLASRFVHFVLLCIKPDDDQNWRIPLIIGVLWSLLLIGVTFTVPESFVSDRSLVR